MSRDGALDLRRSRAPSRCRPCGAAAGRRRRGTSRPCRPGRAARTACRPPRTRGQVVALGAGERAVRDARVAADAVDPVDGEVAGLELLGDRVRAPAREPRRRAGVAAGAEQVLLGGHGQASPARTRTRRRAATPPVRPAPTSPITSFARSSEPWPRAGQHEAEPAIRRGRAGARRARRRCPAPCPSRRCRGRAPRRTR